MHKKPSHTNNSIKNHQTLTIRMKNHHILTILIKNHRIKTMAHQQFV